jgi:nucleoside-diphosphate-sugar epimerase
VTKRDLRFVTVPHAFCLRALAGEPLEIHAGAAAPAGFIHIEDALDALLLAARSSGYAPANAVGEVTTVASLADLVRRAAAERGIDVRVHSSAPADRSVSQPAFTVTSRLEDAGWQPARRLAETVPAILDYYASRRPFASGETA